MAEPKGAPAPPEQPAAPAPPEHEPPARDVFEAIRRVMRDLPGIGKLTPEQHKARRGGANERDEGKGISYSYRSIEQVTAETQRLFAHHGVVLVPQLLDAPEPRAFTMGSSGTRWEDVKLTVLYWVVGPGGAQRHFQQVPTFDTRNWWMTGDVFTAGPFVAVGRDNSDKGYNKAMTQAEKQCLLQLLQIGDPKDDPDNERHLDEGSRPAATTRGGTPAEDEPGWKVNGWASQEEAGQKIGALLEAVKSLNPEHTAEVGTWLKDRGYFHPEGDNAGKPWLAAIRAEDAPVLAELVKALIAQERKAEADAADSGASQAPSDPTGAADAPAGNDEGQGEPGPEGHTEPNPGQSEPEADSGAPAGPGGSQGPSGRRPRNPR